MAGFSNSGSNRSSSSQDRPEHQSSESEESVTKYVQIPKKDCVLFEQKGLKPKPRVHLVAYRNKGLKAVPRNLSSHPNASSHHELPSQREEEHSHSDNEFPIHEKHQLYYVSSNSDFGEDDSDGNPGVFTKPKPTVVLKARSDLIQAPRKEQQMDVTTEDEEPDWCASDMEKSQEPKRKRNCRKRESSPTSSSTSAAASN